MQENLISVIVPVYNVEKYLSVCVDSILNQDYQNLEVILVNDGSKDGSSEVCHHYEDTDNRVKVIDKANEGAGAARNAGLEIAQGEYIMFIDSDDWIESDMLTHLYGLLCENNADVSICNYYTEKADGSESVVYPMPIQDDPAVTNDISQCIAMLDGEGKFPYLWNRLYKRKIIEEQKVRFENQFTTGEDLDFNLKYFRHVKSCILSNKPLYHYIKNGTGSLCARYKDGLYEIVSELSKRRLKLYKDLGMERNEEYMNVYKKTYIEYIGTCIPNMFRSNAPLKATDRVAAMQRIFNDKDLNAYIGGYKPRNAIGKIFKTMVRIGKPKLAVKVYSALFWVRNDHSGVYQFLRKQGV